MQTEITGLSGIEHPIIMGGNAMNNSQKWDTTGKIVALAVFVGLVLDGMDLQMLSLALPQIMKDGHVSSVMAGALATWTFMGMGVGGIFGGWVSDRFGRVRVVWWSIAIFSVLTSLIAVTSGYWQVAVLRFLSGLGLGGLYSIGNLLAAEYAPTRIRTTVGGLMQAGWSVGYIAAAILSSYILPNLGWRPLFAVAIIPGAIALVLLRGVKDPPSWFAARDAAKQAGKMENEFRLIWANRTMRLTLIFWMITSIMLQFGYYGCVSWLPSYLVKDLGVDLKSMGWYVAATYTSMITGKLIAGYLADKLGRKALWLIVHIGTAAALPLVVKYANAGNVAYMLLIFGFFYGAPWAIAATYMNESYPTIVRGTGASISHNAGRIGSMLSPLAIGFMATQYSIGAGIALLGIAYFIAGVVPGIWIKEKMYDPKAGESTVETIALASEAIKAPVS
jgi:AAHS family cis,cis-muconate transporter-like MFS transporter